MKSKILIVILLFISSISLSNCGSFKTNQTNTSFDDEIEEINTEMNVKIDNYIFEIKLESNSTTKELIKLLENDQLTIEFNDYGGFEKVGPLGRNLSVNDKWITTKSGDIVLYQGNQIVMFYGSNSWNYTMIGHVTDLSFRNEALTKDNLIATFSLK